MSTLFVLLFIISLIAIPVLLLILLTGIIRKRKVKKTLIGLGASSFLGIASLIGCGVTAPAPIMPESIELKFAEAKDSYDINSEIPVEIIVYPQDADTSMFEYVSDSSDIIFEDGMITAGSEAGIYEVYITAGAVRSNVLSVTIGKEIEEEFAAAVVETQEMSQTEAEPESEAESEAAVEIITESESETETEPESESENDAKAEKESEQETIILSENEAGTETEIKTEETNQQKDKSEEVKAPEEQKTAEAAAAALAEQQTAEAAAKALAEQQVAEAAAKALAEQQAAEAAAATLAEQQAAEAAAKALAEQQATEAAAKALADQQAAEAAAKALAEQQAAEAAAKAAAMAAQPAGGSYAVNGKNGKIHIVGACSATGNGEHAMDIPVYFETYEEAEAYSVQIAPKQKKRPCGNCW